jgi:tripartite-type tricarboxylate transporter receptor subunit TctC
LPHIRSGKLKGLGVTSLKRTSTAPELPTVAETLPGFEAVSWQAIFVPSKTPREVIQKLADVAARAAQAPEIRSRLEGMGQEVVGGTPEQLDARVKADLAVYARIVREAKIPLQD